MYICPKLLNLYLRAFQVERDTDYLCKPIEVVSKPWREVIGFMLPSVPQFYAFKSAELDLFAHLLFLSLFSELYRRK